jgi:hypothetical protein
MSFSFVMSYLAISENISEFTEKIATFFVINESFKVIVELFIMREIILRL